MSRIKDSPKSASTLAVKADANYRISKSTDPLYSFMGRLFQDNDTTKRGVKFIQLLKKRQIEGNSLKINELDLILIELSCGKSSFYAMRNRLKGAGIISIRKREYRLSLQFSADLIELSDFWTFFVRSQIDIPEIQPTD